MHLIGRAWLYCLQNKKKYRVVGMEERINNLKIIISRHFRLFIAFHFFSAIGILNLKSEHFVGISSMFKFNVHHLLNFNDN